MMAARDSHSVLDPNTFPPQPGHLPWALEARNLSAVFARPQAEARMTRRGDFARMDDLDSIWADEDGSSTSW